MRYWILAAFPLCLPAQDSVLTLPRVGVVDFYGLHTVGEALVTQALGVRPGSPMPESRLNAEERINDIDRVLASHLEAVCCNEAGEVSLYVGIEEIDAPHYQTRPTPGGADLLPVELMTAYERGVSLPADRLAAIATLHASELRHVLREASDDRHRAAAIFLLSYAMPANEATIDLEYALRDASPTVRTIAVRRLVDLAEVARRDAATRIRVNPALFIDMLHSLYWTDRVESARALVALTGPPGDPATLARLRTGALDALIEMARWKTADHARPAFQLVGRIAGMSENQIDTAFLRNERERVIAAAQRSAPGR